MKFPMANRMRGQGHDPNKLYDPIS